MPLSKEKADQLRLKMEKLGISEKDLIEKFILGSGSGGQKINKTSSCVYLKHIPTGIEIKCQKARSRELNRYYARYELVERLKEKVLHEKSERQKEIEKKKRQKRKRSKRSQLKILVDKRHRSDVKGLRKSPKGE